MRNNYASGANFERLVRSYYEKKGMYCVRSAGSHGAVDCLAWDAIHFYLIQCKKEKKKHNYQEDIQKLRQVPLQTGWKRLLWIKKKSVIEIHDIDWGTIEYMSLKELKA